MLYQYGNRFFDSLVSVVMPCYNGQDGLVDAVRSVQAQSYEDWELVVVDDGSSDGSWEILLRFAAIDSRIIVLKNEAKIGVGPAEARNVALAKARGRYVAFLDCDDVWYEHKIRSHIDFMRKSGSCLSYGDYFFIDAVGTVLGRCSSFFQKTGYYKYLLFMNIGCLTVVVDRKGCGDFFMPIPLGCYFYEDYATWLNLLKTVRYAVRVPGVHAGYRLTEGSIASSKSRAILFRLRCLVETQFSCRLLAGGFLLLSIALSSPLKVFQVVLRKLGGMKAS